MIVAIVDYQLGNLRSVSNAVASLGHEPRICQRPEEVRDANCLILPGVGAFGQGMANLRERCWVEALEDEVRCQGKPILGLCLGMQLFATSSSEHGTHDGLNWIPGHVERMPVDSREIRLPHIGWNDVQIVSGDGLYHDLGDAQAFYFVHSYAYRPDDANVISGLCAHGEEFAASIEKDNIFATQYHPEKSQTAGLKVLDNFLRTAA